MNPIIEKADRHDDVRFRGKAIDDLSREEAIDALRQAISQVKRLGFMPLSSPLIGGDNGWPMRNQGAEMTTGVQTGIFK